MALQFKRKPLSIEDQDRLVNACKSQNEILVIVGLLETGLRVSEFCNLTRQNFRWQEGVFIVDGKGGPFGKMSKTRTIPLTPQSRELFQKFFTWKDTIPFKTRRVQQIVKRVADRAGIMAEVCPHVLRHTFAIRAIEKGIPSRAVQLVLGHDRLSTTEIYLNISGEAVKQAFKEKW